MHALVRRNGTCYTQDDDLEKTITGTLYGSKFFEKDTLMGTWTINAEKAASWETAMLNRIDEKKPWNAKSNPGVNTNTMTSMNFLNKNPIYNKQNPAFMINPDTRIGAPNLIPSQSRQSSEFSNVNNIPDDTDQYLV